MFEWFANPPGPIFVEAKRSRGAQLVSRYVKQRFGLGIIIVVYHRFVFFLHFPLPLPHPLTLPNRPREGYSFLCLIATGRFYLFGVFLHLPSPRSYCLVSSVAKVYAPVTFSPTPSLPELLSSARVLLCNPTLGFSF